MPTVPNYRSRRWAASYSDTLLEEQIKQGASLLKDTLSRCWAFGQAKARWGEVQDLLNHS